jgi:hypothetical protein
LICHVRIAIAIPPTIVKSFIQKKMNDTTVSHEQIEKDLVMLSHNIYRLNLKMIELVQSGKIGLFNPDHKKEK